MFQKSFLMMPKSLIEDLEETCEKLDELREHYTDLLEQSRSCPTITVTSPSDDWPTLFPRAPTAEDLLKIF